VAAFFRGKRIGTTTQRGKDRLDDFKRVEDKGDVEGLDDFWAGKR